MAVRSTCSSSATRRESAGGLRAGRPGGGRAALVTVVASEPGGGDVRVGARMLLSSEGDVLGTLGDRDLDRVATGYAEDLMWAERSEAFPGEGVTLFVDVVHPPPRLVVFGAVDFAAELCRMARAAGGIPTSWIPARALRPPSASRTPRR
ncbi:MAG: XdhC family protein [Thermoleophilaceae bacterium]